MKISPAGLKGMGADLDKWEKQLYENKQWLLAKTQSISRLPEMVCSEPKDRLRPADVSSLTQDYMHCTSCTCSWLTQLRPEQHVPSIWESVSL